MKRLTQARLMVLRVMLSEPERLWHGYDLATRTGLGSGSIAPMLLAFATDGLVLSSWEDPAAARAEGRGARHFFQLNAAMLPYVRQLVGDGLPWSLGSEYQRALAVGDGEKTREQADAERFNEGMGKLRERALNAMPLLFAHLTPAERRDLARRLLCSLPSMDSDGNESPHPAAFAVLNGAFRSLGCTAALDSGDPDDCASVADEAVRALISSGILAPAEGVHGLVEGPEAGRQGAEALESR